MATKLTQGGTTIYKFNEKDKKDIGHKFNYAVVQGNKRKGFKTITQVNRALGTKYTLRSFKKS